MLTQCAMSFSGEPSTTRLHLFIRGMRYFTALRSVQYDNFALRVILSVAKNLKKKKKRRHYFFPHYWRFSLLAVVRTTRTTAILFQKKFFVQAHSKRV